MAGTPAFLSSGRSCLLPRVVARAADHHPHGSRRARRRQEHGGDGCPRPARADSIGVRATGAIRSLVAAFFKRPSTALLSAIGIVVLVFGAAGVFDHVKQTLDEIWGVTPRSVRGILYVLRRSSLAVLSVAGSVLVHPRARQRDDRHRGCDSYGRRIVSGRLVAVHRKSLPDTQVRWTDVWVGAASTAVLFIAGQFVIGFLLVRSDWKPRSTVRSYPPEGQPHLASPSDNA